MPRYVTLQEAQRALPDIEQMLRRMRGIRAEALSLRGQVEGQWRAMDEGGAALAQIAQEQRRLDALQEEFGALVQDLEARGAILRDIDKGLVDFPSLWGDAQIYLCWKLGEESIAFWHGLGEGYAGRKPLSALPRSRSH